MAEDQTITIDNNEYDLGNLSEKAKAQLKNLRIAEREIQRLQMQLALAKTARNTYANTLKAELPSGDQ